MGRDGSLGQALVESGRMSAEELKTALSEAKRTGLGVEQILIRRGVVSEEEAATLLADRLGFLFVDLTSYFVEPQVVSLIPEKLARKHRAMPIFKIGDTLTVACVNPRDLAALDELRRAAGCELRAVVTTESSVRRAIDQYYAVTGTIDEIVSTLEPEALPREVSPKDLEALAEEAPIVKIVTLLMRQAVRDHASDIHVEPDGDLVRIRFRVDGVLHEMTTLPVQMHPAVISRIKILAKLDIAEKRLPQDGRIEARIEDRDLDFRVSVFPTVHGENAVLRLLDRTSVLFGLEDLGFAKDDLRVFNGLVHQPYGIILVTGPTGSGKTTTLYSALNILDATQLNIQTLEDPVEYQMPRVRQTQVNPKIGLTFAGGLRAILRQDPDVILVGEIRDRETAEIAIHASLTGHLVFSTLHTNDAPGALTRLTDMGIEPFLSVSSMSGVVAQRLVRRICGRCREAYEPARELMESPELQRAAGATDQPVQFFRGRGCKQCFQTGYRGRIGLFELMVMKEPVRRLVLARASSETVRGQAVELGMRPLREDGLHKVVQGITTFDEVLRVAREEAV